MYFCWIGYFMFMCVRYESPFIPKDEEIGIVIKINAMLCLYTVLLDSNSLCLPSNYCSFKALISLSPLWMNFEKLFPPLLSSSVT